MSVLQSCRSFCAAIFMHNVNQLARSAVIEGFWDARLADFLLKSLVDSFWNNQTDILS